MVQIVSLGHVDIPSQNLLLVITPTLYEQPQSVRGKHLSTSDTWTLPRIYLACLGPFANMGPRGKVLLLGYSVDHTALLQSKQPDTI
jgi:hypothetical protein